MTESNGPFLMRVEMICASPNPPSGLTKNALNLVAKIVNEITYSVFIARMQIEQASFLMPGRLERFIDLNTLISREFADANSVAVSIISKSKKKALEDLKILRDGLTPSDRDRVQSLIAQIEIGDFFGVAVTQDLVDAST